MIAAVMLCVALLVGLGVGWWLGTRTSSSKLAASERVWTIVNQANQAPMMMEAMRKDLSELCVAQEVVGKQLVTSELSLKQVLSALVRAGLIRQVVRAKEMDEMTGEEPAPQKTMESQETFTLPTPPKGWVDPDDVDIGEPLNEGKGKQKHGGALSEQHT